MGNSHKQLQIIVFSSEKQVVRTLIQRDDFANLQDSLARRKLKDSRNQENNLVAVKDFWFQQSTNLCSAFENICITLQNITCFQNLNCQFQGEKGLSYLSQIINGIYHLLKFTDTPFSIDQNMMGYDENSNLKIWFSSNFIDYRPQKPILESQSNYGTQHLTLQQLFKNFPNKTFEQVRNNASIPLRALDLMNQIAMQTQEGTLNDKIQRILIQQQINNSHQNRKSHCQQLLQDIFSQEAHKLTLFDSTSHSDAYSFKPQTLLRRSKTNLTIQACLRIASNQIISPILRNQNFSENDQCDQTLIGLLSDPVEHYSEVGKRGMRK